MKSNVNTDPSLHNTALPVKKSVFSKKHWALVLLFFTPALLSSNMIVAKAVHDVIPPFTLAFTRWLVAFLVLMPFIGHSLWQQRQTLKKEWVQLLLLGFLGMGICGAFPYLGAQTTTATNIGLIYAMSPVFIILFARTWYQEILSRRQICGVALSLLGVVVIVAKGDVSVFVNLQFSAGDLWIVAASASWGFYSLWQGHLKTQLTLFQRFSAMSLGGVLVLLPFSLYEVYYGFSAIAAQTPKYQGDLWPLYLQTITFLALISSITAYAAYAYIQRILGAAKASLVMYAIPLYNAAMAWILLGEKLQVFHFLGALFILPGLFLAVGKAAKAKPLKD